MTTCYDIDTGEAGVRWEWIDSDDAEECKNKVTKYGIVVSSSQYNHNVKYRFPDVIGRDSNAFKFNNAPSEFLEGQNVKFEITPLNDINEKIANTVVATLDTNNSTEICNAHGDPVDFSSAELLGDVGSKPTLNPTPCEGNTYTPPTECMRDGVVLDGTPGKCGDGLVQWSLDTSAADYVAATDGGECVLAHSRGCHVDCPPDAPPPADCNQYVPGWNNAGLGCVKDNFDHNNPPANDSDYVKMGDCYPAGEKDGVKMRYKVATDPINCSNLTEWVACGLTECPINCVGSWVDNGSEFTENATCPAQGNKKNHYQPQIYRVTTQANATGAACETTNGATRNKFTGTSGVCRSDKRLKKNIQLYKKDCPVVGVDSYTFEWNDIARELYGYEGGMIGFIADLLPQEYIANDEHGYKCIILDDRDDTISEIKKLLHISNKW